MTKRKQKPKRESKLMTISQPTDWAVAWKQQAKSEGMTLSAWIGECCNLYLTDAAAGKLTARKTAGGSRPRKPKPKPAAKPTPRIPIAENFAENFQT